MDDIKKVKASLKATEQDFIKLPEMTPEETAWVDKLDPDWKPSKELKRLLFLPAKAYKTAVYVHKKKLSKSQKDLMILLFRGEAEQAINVVFEQALLVVGNSPTDRVAYLNDYESWNERLIKLFEKAINCITRDDLIKNFESFTIPPIDTLSDSEKQSLMQEVTRKMTWMVSLGKDENIFYEPIYMPKFSQFTLDALKLLRRFSLMHTITMERPEWIIQSAKNLGVLPDHIKAVVNKKKLITEQENFKGGIEKIISERLESLSEKIITLTESLNEIKVPETQMNGHKAKNILSKEVKETLIAHCIQKHKEANSIELGRLTGFGDAYVRKSSAWKNRGKLRDANTSDKFTDIQSEITADHYTVYEIVQEYQNGKRQKPTLEDFAKVLSTDDSKVTVKEASEIVKQAESLLDFSIL